MFSFLLLNDIHEDSLVASIHSELGKPDRLTQLLAENSPIRSENEEPLSLLFFSLPRKDTNANANANDVMQKICIHRTDSECCRSGRASMILVYDSTTRNASSAAMMESEFGD